MSKLDSFVDAQERMLRQSEAEDNANRRSVAGCLYDFVERDLKPSLKLKAAGVEVHSEQDGVVLTSGSKNVVLVPTPNGVSCVQKGSILNPEKTVPLRSLKQEDREKFEKGLVEFIWSALLKSDWEEV
jgi:hypothetical protein